MRVVLLSKAAEKTSNVSHQRVQGWSSIRSERKGKRRPHILAEVGLGAEGTWKNVSRSFLQRVGNNKIGGNENPQ